MPQLGQASASLFWYEITPSLHPTRFDSHRPLWLVDYFEGIFFALLRFDKAIGFPFPNVTEHVALSIFADQEQITFVRDKLHFADYFRHFKNLLLKMIATALGGTLIALQVKGCMVIADRKKK
jgi:hypothetical protein